MTMLVWIGLLPVSVALLLSMRCLLVSCLGVLLAISLGGIGGVLIHILCLLQRCFLRALALRPAAARNRHPAIDRDILILLFSFLPLLPLLFFL